MRHVTATIAFALVLTFTPFISGCGKKGPPIQPPPKSEPVKTSEALPPAEVTVPEETPHEAVTEETTAEEEIETGSSHEAAPDDNGTGSEEDEAEIFPPEMTPKELLRMDEAPEDWI